MYAMWVKQWHSAGHNLEIKNYDFTKYPRIELRCRILVIDTIFNLLEWTFTLRSVKLSEHKVISVI